MFHSATIYNACNVRNINIMHILRDGMNIQFLKCLNYCYRCSLGKLKDFVNDLSITDYCCFYFLMCSSENLFAATYDRFFL